MTIMSMSMEKAILVDTDDATNKEKNDEYSIETIGEIRLITEEDIKELER